MGIELPEVYFESTFKQGDKATFLDEESSFLMNYS